MSKLKRILKRTAIGVAILVAVSLIVNAFLAWNSGRRLDAKLAELRAAGEPVSLAELAPKPIPPEQNAAAYLQKLGPLLTAFNREYAEYQNTPPGEQLNQATMMEGRLPTAEQLAEVRKILDRHAKVSQLLTQAAACPSYASLLNYNLSPIKFLDAGINISAIRGAFNYAQWEMFALTAEGKRDEAVQLGIQMLHLATLFDAEPLLVHHLVSIAMRGIIHSALNTALRNGPISDEVHGQLETELAKTGTLTPLLNVLRKERAFGISMLADQAGLLPKFLRWPLRNWQLELLDVHDMAIAAASLSVEELHWGSWDPVKMKPNLPPELAAIEAHHLVGAGLSAIFQAETRYILEVRSLRVLNALEAYRHRTGHDVENIEQLGLPAEATTDPITGKPLRLKKTADGWVIYSLWWNGQDDDGRLNYQDGDWGIGPPAYPQK